MNIIEVLCVSSLLLSAIPGSASVRLMKEGDPNLDPKWDWTVRTPYQVYASKGSSIDRHDPWSPYYTAGNPLMKASDPDHFPEDGWVLVHRDFGTPESAQPFPLYTLYNKYRGIFRVMLFNAMAREEAYYVGEISFLGGGSKDESATGLIAFNDDKRPFLKDFDPTLKVVATSYMRALGDWAVFDFPFIGYDPTLYKKDPILTFTLSAIEKAKITTEAKGDMELWQSISRNEVRSGFSMNATELYSDCMNTVNTYDDSKAFIRDEIMSKDGIAKNKDKLWFPIVSKLAGTAIGTMYPYAMALGGLLNSYIGGSGKGNIAEQLNFSGQFKFSMNGDIQTKRNLWAHNFYLNHGEQDAMAQRPLQAIHWGVFSIVEKPYYTNGNLTRTGAVDPRPEYWSHYNSKYRNVARLLEAPKVMVNPTCGMKLVSTRVGFAFEKPKGLAMP